MSVRVAVVTGANKGIGFAIVRRLCASFDGDVILTARNEKRGKIAVCELERENYHPKFHLLDVENMESIRKFRDFLKVEYGGLDVLVNNAAIAYKVASTAALAEQAENTIKVNYFAVLNVCHELFPLLRPHARVVHVSSSAGKLLNIPGKELKAKFADPNLTEEELSNLMNQFVSDVKLGIHKENGWTNTCYQISKIGLNALMSIQHRDFCKDEREDIVINAVHPGYVKTDMTSNKGNLSPAEGAEAPTYLALLPPNIDSPRGEFVWYNKQIVPWK